MKKSEEMITLLYIACLPLLIILLQSESTQAKAFLQSENPDLRNESTKSTASDSLDHEIGFRGSEYSDFDTRSSSDTGNPDDEKFTGDLVSQESYGTASSLWISSEEFHEVATTENIAATASKDNIDRLSVNSNPDLDKGGSLATTLNPAYWVPDTVVTSLELVSGGTGSLVTSLESGSGAPDSLVTTEESGKLPVTLDLGTGEPASLSTTFRPDSGETDSFATTLWNSGTPHGVGTTSKPGTHDPSTGHKFENLTKNERSNGSVGGASWATVLLGILLISGSKVT